jgi:predicted dehydrogenase
MERETQSFLEAISLGKQPVVTMEQARLAMRVYQAADLSVETNAPVELTHEPIAISTKTPIAQLA